MKKVVQSVIVVTLVLTALSGCKTRGDLNTQYSNTTGWNYYEKKTTNFEAKEGVEVNRESKTLATITFQNYFRMYPKLSGMTGTALTEEEEVRGT